MPEEEGTQTDGDAVDGAAMGPPNNNGVGLGAGPLGDAEGLEEDGGFLSNLLTMVGKKRRVSGERNSRTIATQTEEQDPLVAKGQQLSYLLIQELGLDVTVPSGSKDEVYNSLSSCICELLVKHSFLFNGMVGRTPVNHYHVFCCIANEIFEASESGHLNVTWGRIISLFAFAVRLAQEYREDQEHVDSIIRYLASYVTKQLIPFVRSQGGWENLVEHYPRMDEDEGIPRALLWSGLCVGLMATMYVSSYLASSR